ncbi:hypothetical protein UWK_00772 [Desulfocapsa sulfexigens DSM 10523]|uniref:Lipoprotein n=1 Tax=Desulfocapsa sulfexigens (strain DSM 10523 / SB164P1) TaxID=1167006 RepID=M1PC74_DESSD|nr:hypothetical protein [Desulfocapsa sulfexigens]AGF77350.1 hypothetical protein UWK_00772 [Desulfocapsa sulfexigens DSM 10523]
MKPTKLLTLLIPLVTISLVGCNEVELQSQWTEPISLNGRDAAWPENPQYFDENSRVRVSMMNDEDSLYIRLLSRNQVTNMMLLRTGFTVWLDDTGENRKTFGLQFPLARQNLIPGRMSDHKTRNGMEEMLEDTQYSLAILSGVEETRQTLPTNKAEEMGIYVRLGMQQGYLVYELKVPLTYSKKNNTIGVGLETGKPEKPSGKVSSGGGRGGRGGGGGGKKMGGKGGAQGGGSHEPIEIWAKVYLAKNATLKDREGVGRNGIQLLGNKSQNK